jgi:MoxR-like ATPase
MNKDLQAIEQEVNTLVGKLDQLKTEIHKSIVGQEEVIDQLLTGLLARGHVLIEGLPGLAKTMMIKNLAKAVNLDFNRIQFTPDLMPTDIIGTEMIEEDGSGHRAFKFNKGPVFTNILLADEINRTPPKTQAALLEVMQEYKVTYGGKDYRLDDPFFLLATQNPIEQSGTFPLPEAQVDRFLLYVLIDYPSEQEEADMLRLTTGKSLPKTEPVLSGEEILKLQKYTREVFIDDALLLKINRLVRTTRPALTDNEVVKEYVDFGAGPRAGQAIIMTAKANALINGRFSVTPEDIRKVVHPAMRHRMLLNFKAESQKMTTDQIIDTLVKEF